MDTTAYFTIVLAQGYGIGGFASLDEARRYCRGDNMSGKNPLRIDEYEVPVGNRDNSGVKRAVSHPVEAAGCGPAT